jgi:hypothetical protein
MNEPTVRSAWKGLVVVSWAMDRFQYWWLSFREQAELQLQQTPIQERKQDKPATVKTASVISEGVFGHNLTVKEKEIAGLHWFTIRSARPLEQCTVSRRSTNPA